MVLNIVKISLVESRMVHIFTYYGPFHNGEGYFGMEGSGRGLLLGSGEKQPPLVATHVSNSGVEEENNLNN